LLEFGFQCSLPNLAIKKDITKFLQIPEETLNSFLHRRDDIKATSLSLPMIQSLGSKAKRMNGYLLNEVAKIAFGMDTVMGIKLKNAMFGTPGIFAKYPKEETVSYEFFSKIFSGMGLHHHYQIGKYEVDFFVEELGLCLECNGYTCHKYYEPEEEKNRENFISSRYALVRFHHKISLEVFINGVLKAKKGKIIRLYDVGAENKKI
jgi:very-short-patch-repair endonuclease